MFHILVDGQEELGIEPPTPRLTDDLLYLQSPLHLILP